MAQLRKFQRDNPFQLIDAESVEDNQIVDPVQELRREMCLYSFHHLVPNFFRVQKGVANPLAADVGGHDNNCVLEIDGASLPIRHSAVIEHLE